MHSCPIFMPGHSVIGRLATLDSSSVMWPLKPGSMKPAVECVSSPSRPSDDLPSSRPARSSGSVTSSSVEPSTNSPGMQHERLPFGGFHQAGQLVLLLGGVDVGVAGVVENPEHAVEANVDAGRLHQGVVERVDAQPPGGDFGPEVTIGEQHPTSLSAACGRAVRAFSPRDTFPHPWGIRLRWS